MNNWQLNNPTVAKLSMLKQRSRQRKMLRRLLLIAFVLMLLGLTGLLSGCATRSVAQSLPPTAISMPVPPKSPPLQSFSQQVQTFLDESAKKLTSGLSTE